MTPETIRPLGVQATPAVVVAFVGVLLILALVQRGTALPPPASEGSDPQLDSSYGQLPARVRAERWAVARWT